MNKILLSVLLLTSLIHVKAQNLVSNPGFELFSEHPTKFGQITLAKNWMSANTGTPEYYRTDSRFYDGKAHFGKGYAGLILFGDYPKAIEYISQELKSPLEAEQTYHISFWIRAKESFMYIDKIGVTLTQENIRVGMWAPIYRQAQIVSEANSPITPHLGWHKIEGEYKAVGGEQFITIGNFIQPDHHILSVDEFAVRESGWNSYYFIDDVTVQIAGTLEADSSGEDLLVDLSNSARRDTLMLFFDSDMYLLKDSELEKLAKYIKECPEGEQTICIKAHTDSVGSREYNLELARKRMVQVRKKVVAFCANHQKFKLDYFGEEIPQESNSTLKGRAANRRVELYYLQND